MPPIVEPIKTIPNKTDNFAQAKKIKIMGGNALNGEITPSGNKNSALPMLCATLLADGPQEIHHLPNLRDVQQIIGFFQQLGSEINWNQDEEIIHINHQNADPEKIGSLLPGGMRASLLLLAPLLARFKKLEIKPKIGGCSLGIREIDPHLEMLQALGTKVEQENGKLKLEIQSSFREGHLWPDYASVTGTENVLMATVTAQGTTIINNAASEPHVQNLCQMLLAMGAEIEGVGSNQLIIHGVKNLKPTKSVVWSDHHEITTFLALGAITQGKILVHQALPEMFPLIIRQFQKLGVEIQYEEETAIVKPPQTFEPIAGFTKNFIPQIQADPWPFFPADLLPLMIPIALKTKGPVRFWNKVYEKALDWVGELQKMGATIYRADPHRIMTLGPCELNGANIDCPPIIRATVALIMATLSCEGESTLNNVETVWRGHPHFFENLIKMGAEIEILE